MIKWLLILIITSPNNVQLSAELVYDSQENCEAALIEIASIWSEAKPKYSRCIPMEGLINE